MTEQGATFDVDRVTPEEFAALVANAEDDQITEVIRDIGTERVLDRVFEGMEQRFRSDKAEGVNATIQFVINDQQEHPYKVDILGGSCSAARGTSGDPKVTISTDLVSFSRMISGQADGMQLFMRGRLKAKGDLMFATRIMGFFDRPTPAS